MNAVDDPTTAETVLEPLGVHRTPIGGARVGSPEYNEELEAKHPEYVAAKEAYHNSPDRLFNAVEPRIVIAREKPVHRIMLLLKAEGKSNTEIADITDFSLVEVNMITQQPWFRLRLMKVLEDAGRDRISTLLKSAAEDSVYTLIGLRDDPTSPKAVRKSAADSLLDRWIGKPVQKVELENTKLPSTEEIRSLDAQIAECDRQLETPQQPQNEPQK